MPDKQPDPHPDAEGDEDRIARATEYAWQEIQRCDEVPSLRWIRACVEQRMKLKPGDPIKIASRLVCEYGIGVKINKYSDDWRGE